MSDWAAKLLQKPSLGQNATNAQKANILKIAPAQTGPHMGNVNTNSTKQPQQPQQQAKVRPAKPFRQESPLRSAAALPEPFNGAEILAFLTKRFNADLEDAQRDKSGEEAMIYRSLEASSSWKTKGPSSGRKYNKDEDRFDLLQEINRGFQSKAKRY
ncbi:hypothetical protein HF325_001424 [Metschnikowia pulcherrima]|uniref:Uncharacterized protein n=1 Tax=Metschnikowia pulcherrima TaxID=27326 RepID=A0A8H7GWP2_9ASCO|nr:hypothetical protein HF325_001424 [Metschnikowia pulcherrima]